MSNQRYVELHDVVVVAEDRLSQWHQKIRQYVGYHRDNPAVTVDYSVQYAGTPNSYFDTAERIDDVVVAQVVHSLRLKYTTLLQLHKSRDTLPPKA